MTKLKTGLGYSHLTDKVYYGKQNTVKGMWSGEKKDVTQGFIAIAFEFFPLDKTKTIICGIDGKLEANHMFFHVTEDVKSIKKLINTLNKSLAKLTDKKSKK